MNSWIMSTALKKLFINRFVYGSNYSQFCIKYEKSLFFNSRYISNEPYLTSGHKKAQTINAVSPKNMSLRHCSPIPSITLMEPMMDSMVSMDSSVRRPLTVILSWMLAKEPHLEKYRQLWFRRGFDVLTVKTSPIDLLLPPIGGQVVASNLVKYLTEISPQYKEIVIHAFSVGGYQYGEILLKLKSSDEYKTVCDSLKGIIIDSMVHVEDAAPGLSRAFTRNVILQPLLEATIASFLAFTKTISLENYNKSSNEIFENFLGLPGLLLFSSNDVVSESKSNIKLAEKWSQKGLPVQTKCWPESTHVLHYRDHQREYEEQLDLYLKKLKLSSGNIV